MKYVRKFKTSSGTNVADGNDSGGRGGVRRAKWITVRLAFADFRPRMRGFAYHGDKGTL